MAAIGMAAAQGTPTSAPGVTPVPRDTSTWSGWKPADLTNLTAQAILNGIGISRPNATQARMMVAWINSEQPNFLHVNDNPLDTTLNPAAGRIGAGGTQGNIDIFDTIAHGVAADVQTIQNHPAIVAALQSANPAAFFAAIGPWDPGNPGYGSYVQRVYNGVNPASAQPIRPGGSIALQGDAAQKAINDAQGTNSPTGDLSKVPIIGAAAPAIDTAAGAISSLSGLVSWLTNSHNWLRLGEILAGGALTAIAVWALVKGRTGVALVTLVGGYVFVYGGIKDVRPIDEIRAAFGGGTHA